MPHGWNTALGLAADLHLASACRNTDMVEYLTGSPFIDEIVASRWQLDVEGMLRVPEGPGLGICLDLDAIEKYTSVKFGLITLIPAAEEGVQGETSVRKNEVKQKLRDRECLYGTSLEDSLDPEMAVLLSAAGLNFFFIDTEHSPANYAQIQGLCRAAAGASITPLVSHSERTCPYLSRVGCRRDGDHCPSGSLTHRSGNSA